MKKTLIALITILYVVTICFSCKQSVTDSDLITVDVTENYPKKELILQDFMAVEYIPLETTDEFITQGIVMAIGDKYIVVKNRTNDGDIFVFDRYTGKGLKKINRKGQGAEEYAFINDIVLDEGKDELFVNSSSMNKIFVYDISGNFKRGIEHPKGIECLNICNCDKDNLILYDISGYHIEGESRGDKSYHMIISKQDGSITQNIAIPFDVIRAPIVKQGDGFAISSVRSMIPYHDNWLLVETSSDTIYKYIPKENKLSPFLVTTSTMDTEMFLTMGTLTDRYYFMQTIKKVFDFTTGRGFPIDNIMYDKQENTVFSVSVLNDDFLKKGIVDMGSRPVNDEIATFQSIAANQIVEAYENNELKGRLKEIATGLDEESNPVIMLVKSKR